MEIGERVFACCTLNAWHKSGMPGDIGEGRMPGAQAQEVMSFRLGKVPFFRLSFFHW